MGRYTLNSDLLGWEDPPLVWVTPSAGSLYKRCGNTQVIVGDAILWAEVLPDYTSGKGKLSTKHACIHVSPLLIVDVTAAPGSCLDISMMTGRWAKNQPFSPLHWFLSGSLITAAKVRLWWLHWDSHRCDGDPQEAVMGKKSLYVGMYHKEKQPQPVLYISMGLVTAFWESVSTGGSHIKTTDDF